MARSDRIPCAARSGPHGGGDPHAEGFRQGDSGRTPDGVEARDAAGELGDAVNHGAARKGTALDPVGGEDRAGAAPVILRCEAGEGVEGLLARFGPSLPPKVTSSLWTARGCRGIRLGRSSRAILSTTMKLDPRSTRQVPEVVSKGRTLQPFTTFTG